MISQTSCAKNVGLDAASGGSQLARRDSTHVAVAVVVIITAAFTSVCVTRAVRLLCAVDISFVATITGCIRAIHIRISDATKCRAGRN